MKQIMNASQVKESWVGKDKVHLPWMFCQFSEETEASAFIEAGTAHSAALHTSIWSSIPGIVRPVSYHRVAGQSTLGRTFNSDSLSKYQQERETPKLGKQMIRKEAGSHDNEFSFVPFVWKNGQYTYKALFSSFLLLATVLTPNGTTSCISNKAKWMSNIKERRMERLHYIYTIELM